MAKEKQQQTLREYGKQKKRRRRRTMILINLALIGILVALVSYYVMMKNKQYDSYTVMNTIENPGLNAVGYLSYGTAMVRYSKDGAVALNRQGDMLWNGSYEMNDPIAVSSDKYIAIADRGGNLIQVFGEKGTAGKIVTLNNIIKIEVANQGVVAALMEGENRNYIVLYDKDGTILTEIETNVNKSGYPIDIALSKDGTKLVTSYLSVHTGTLETAVAFYNFGEVGMSYTDGLVGGEPFSETIIPKVAFLDNNTVCIFKDNGIKIYSMKEIPELRYEEDFEQKVKSIFYSNSNVGLILNTEDSTSDRMRLYDLDGNQVLEKKIEYNYDNVILSGEEIILYNKVSCWILKINGKDKFRYTFDSELSTILPINNIDQYYLIDTSEILNIMLVE